MSKRNSWYEDDVVEYTTGGQYPKIPKKYQQCYYKIKGKWHTLKSFRTKGLAEAHLRNAVKFDDYNFNLYRVFKCENCQQYHIMSITNYERYVNEDSSEFREKCYVCPIIKNKAK